MDVSPIGDGGIRITIRAVVKMTSTPLRSRGGQRRDSDRTGASKRYGEMAAVHDSFRSFALFFLYRFLSFLLSSICMVDNHITTYDFDETNICMNEKKGAGTTTTT
jgi:hypothetical protein